MAGTISAMSAPALLVMICLHVTSAVPKLSPPVLDCPRYACKCSFGSVTTTDRNGCSMCHCQPTLCTPRKWTVCKKHCANGHVRDENGCLTCQCQPDAPLDCQHLRCDPRLRCINGYDTDGNGCRVCRCKPISKCQHSVCAPPPCPTGFVHKSWRDGHGCMMCGCKRHSCPLRHCRTYCLNPARFGHMIDRCGCPCYSHGPPSIYYL